MRTIPMHVLPIVGAAVAKIVLAALWYSPALFLRPWQRMSGITAAQMQERMGSTLAVDVVGSFLMAFVLAYAIGYAEATTALQGLVIGFWIWLGFIVVATIHTVTYERKPFVLFLLHNGYHLLSLVVMSVIFAIWR
jgi:hypothetical protein